MAKKVLVVDDEKLIVKGIRFSLEQDGMEVTCAYDGEEALLCAKEQKFDMILLDIMLPKTERNRSMPADSGVFGCSDRNAHSQKRRHGQNHGTGIWRR